MRRCAALTIGLCSLSLTVFASAAPYQFRFDGTSFPEDQGWERRFSEPEDGQSVRTVSNGVFDLDTTASISIYDSYYSPGNSLQLDAGEMLRVSWTQQTISNSSFLHRSDVILFVAAPDRSYAELYLGTDFVASDELPGGPVERVYSIQANTFHSYALTSTDFQSYELYVDGVFAFAGQFHGDALSGGGRVVFGDSVIGASSRSVWSEVAVEIAPEPSVALCVAFLIAARGRSWKNP